MGKRESFHPDTLHSSLLKFGAKLKDCENKKWILAFSAEMLETIDNYAGLYSNPELDPLLAPRATREVKHLKRSSSGGSMVAKEDDAPSPLPDFRGPYDWAEAVSQAVSSLCVGADSMDLLKKSRKKAPSGGRTPSARTNEPEIAIHVNGADRAGIREALKRGEVLARCINGARRIAAMPGNHMDPAIFEQYVRGLARDTGLKIKVFQASQLEKMGCGGIIAVGKGSAIPPRMIVLEYTPARAKVSGKLALVGKGITFDTGGISLKPPAEMHEMKFDMCGAALAVHAIASAALRKLPIPVVTLIGLAENMPDGKAIKPGDVYTAYNGTTVEVQNTDAEGRLVLGDVLSYACKHYSPTILMDFATLTGACVIALGHEATAVLSGSDALAGRIDTAARKSLERTWRLPHWQIFDDGLKSDIADTRNIAGRPAGTVTAMRFLSKFVDSHIPWAHFDIAGTAWRSNVSGGQPKGATGWGVRLLTQFMEDLAG
ncbi:MAG: leucyl aminopeptidase [Leptospiraceae bacterium]|nr:leucyl aminopeptidase [Leptospiraceae bacterium]